MKTPPLLKARYVKAFTRAHDEMGLSSEHSLAKAKLHEKALSDTENWIPVSQLGKFVTTSVRQNGCWELGLVAGMLPRQQHSAFSRKSLVQPTLHQSLLTICNNAHMEDTSALFRLVQNGETTWLHCGWINEPSDWIRQLELYRFSALLEVIRFTAGADWLPPVLHLQSADDGRLGNVQLLREIDVRFGSPGLSIQIPTKLLSRSPGNIPNVDLATVNANTESKATGPLYYNEAVRVVIRNQMGHGSIGIADIAGCMGVSTRSLQRYLSMHGTTFSEVVEQTRIQTACDMLSNTGIQHNDIARELGYRHHTHFSRAFRRVCGMTPSQYRSSATSE